MCLLPDMSATDAATKNGQVLLSVYINRQGVQVRVCFPNTPMRLGTPLACITGAQRSFLAQRFASVAGSLPPGSSSTEVESVVREMWRALPPKERYTHTLRYTRGQKRLMLRTSGDPAMAARISGMTGCRMCPPGWHR